MAKATKVSGGTNSGVGSAARWAGYPFVAIVGNRAAKRALMLLAIEPGLRGALIASGASSAEITLARAFGLLLPGLTQACVGSTLGESQADTAVVEVPINVTEDRLLGGLDFERTIATGKRHMSTGILAQANRRVLVVSDINLLEPGISAHIAHALDSRHVLLEREGLSAIHEADFTLIGIFDSAAADSASLLRDRVGLIVDSPAEISADEKAEAIKRAIRFGTDPLKFVDDLALETAQLKGDIEEARERLSRVRVSKKRMRQVSEIAIWLGVEGNRADLFAVRAARANAALEGRAAVIDDDLIVAIQLVLAPRATTVPRDKTELEQTSQPETPDENGPLETDDPGSDSIPGAIDDVIIQALDARVPKDLLSPGQRATRPARNGKRLKASESIRGRYVGSAIHRTRDARIAIDATLRAAAPWQLSRRATDELGNRAAMTSHRRVRIEPGDLRFKEFKHRSGILFIFAVDTSGSMALNRMAYAKGALTRLLQQAYRHRDKVALISFRGDSAEALLAPTRSVELAKRLVDAMPAGGGTPLSAGIVKSIELARLARFRGMAQAMLVLFTDGRANIGLGKRPASPNAISLGDELRQLGELLRSEEIRSVVVDTKSRFVSSGEAESLARALGARYFYLPRSDASAVYDAIASTIGRPRSD